jgi:alpha-glucoside transport system substrate-binding protein
VKSARIMMAAVLAAAVCGCSASAGNGGSVSIMVGFPSGPELSAFQAVINAFERQYGITVTIETTRALSQELGADLQEGDPPDVAALPSIGAVRQYAANGKLKPLGNLVSRTDYGPVWSDLMRSGPGGATVYAAPVKVDVKSLIWYDPEVFRAHGYAVPATWSQLLSLEKSVEAAGGSPFCLGMASPPTSGWPGADWIADILLSQYGPGIYQAWVDGTLPWTSGPVKQSWLTWGRLIGAGRAVYGGSGYALTTSVDRDHPDAGGCYLEHGTLFDETLPWKDNKHGLPETPQLKFGINYGFFPFPFPFPSTGPPTGPSTGAARPAPIQVSGDFIGMFNDTPQARKLIGYLLSTAVQQRLVESPGSDGFSADIKVPLSAYDHDDPAMRPLAEMLRRGELCFGAADAMPPNLETAFDQAILEYLADPGALTSRILPELAKEASASPRLAPGPQVCGPP